MTNVLDYLGERLGRGLDEPITRPKDSGPVDPPPGPPHDGDMTMSSDRLSRLEQEVHAIKGSLDWAKVLFAFLGAVTLGGFSIVFNQIGGLRTETAGAISSLRSDLVAEARTTRAELSATTSAIANSITATKQQVPQVILVPAPATPAK